MSALRVCLFGQLRIEKGDRVVTGLLPPKLQQLLCYLLLFRDRPQPRETLASELWSSSSTARSKRNLRQALWQLQRSPALRDPVGDCDLFLVDAHWIQLNPKAGLWLDTEVLERACAHAEGVPGRLLDAAQVKALRDAVALYHGDLLEDCFQDWCLHERERLQNLFLCALDKLMDYCEAHAEYESGLAYGAQVLQHDGARERTYRRMMRLHCRAGERSAAMHQYDRCVRSLRQELDVPPSQRTSALYQQVRKGRLTALPRSPKVASQGTGSAVSQWSELLGQLREMREDLGRVQAQLEEAICRVERAEETLK